MYVPVLLDAAVKCTPVKGTAGGARSSAEITVFARGKSEKQANVACTPGRSRIGACIPGHRHESTPERPTEQLSAGDEQSAALDEVPSVHLTRQATAQLCEELHILGISSRQCFDWPDTQNLQPCACAMGGCADRQARA